MLGHEVQDIKKTLLRFDELTYFTRGHNSSLVSVELTKKRQLSYVG